MAQTNGDQPRELFLIDGNSLAYRAFFALPESIATSDGRPTNAILGFASMLVKILTDYGPVPTVVVWDAGMSGRKEISADYKAQRSSRPDLLKLQWPHLRPLVEAFGYRNISVEGFEADDVIPGVPGIGDKTAADLLQRFGDLEGVLSHVDEISGAKRKQNLLDHAEDARLSKRLATMVRDVPIDIDLEVEFTRIPDRGNLRAIFREWELRDPLRRLEEALEAAELDAIPRPEDVETMAVTTTPGTPSDVARLPGDELTLIVFPPEIP